MHPELLPPADAVRSWSSTRRWSVFTAAGFLRTRCTPDEAPQISHALLAGAACRTQWCKHNPGEANRWWFCCEVVCWWVCEETQHLSGLRQKSPNGCMERSVETSQSRRKKNLKKETQLWLRRGWEWQIQMDSEMEAVGGGWVKRRNHQRVFMCLSLDAFNLNLCSSERFFPWLKGNIRPEHSAQQLWRFSAEKRIWALYYRTNLISPTAFF